MGNSFSCPAELYFECSWLHLVLVCGNDFCTRSSSTEPNPQCHSHYWSTFTITEACRSIPVSQSWLYCAQLCTGSWIIVQRWGEGLRKGKKGRVEVMAEKIHKHTMERTQQQLSSLQSDWRGAGLGLHSWDGDGWCWFQRWGQVVGVETAQQVVEKNTDACHQPPEQGAIWVHFSHRG